MIALIDTFPIKKAFEWGAGHSTEIMAEHIPCVTSVENDPFYLEMVKENFKVDGVNFICEEDAKYYAEVNGDYAPYDLIFIDGRDRLNCLYKTLTLLSHDGLAILHDAERKEYAEGISLFKHAIFTDNGHTVILTNDDNKASTIRQLLSASPL